MTKRLGTVHDAADVKNHEFFAEVNWARKCLTLRVLFTYSLCFAMVTLLFLVVPNMTPPFTPIVSERFKPYLRFIPRT